MSLPPCVLSTKFEPPCQQVNQNPSHQKIKDTTNNSKQRPITHGPVQDEHIRQPITDSLFHPPIWSGGDFISSSTADVFCEERHKALMKQVKGMLALAVGDPFERLDLVDKIQKLGVAYHFEAEIGDILQRTYNDHKFSEDDRADLYYNSLRFRLLRQAGFHAPSGLFNKYKDGNGEFLANLTSDIQGMLNLYEASFLCIHGEDILDEALAFTTKHLGSIVSCLSPPLALQVQRALTIPLHHGVERVHARHFISIYQDDKSCNVTLLDFAKLDFNMLQLLHKKEILEVSQWWDRLTADIKTKLPFQFRDRIVESYVISMGSNFVPKFSRWRVQQAKLWNVYTIVDDAHDVYGNLEELQPLHDAFQRWDVEDLSELEDHMKVIFHEFKNLYKEIEVDSIRRRHFIGIPYFKKELKKYLGVQFEEASIIFLKDIPTLETWLRFSGRTTGFDAFLVHGVMHLGELATKEVFEWIDSEPELLYVYKLIIRLLDDIATFEAEQERGQTVSNMTCYMKEYGVTKEEAAQGLQKMVRSLWKDMNKSFLKPNPVPRPVLKLIIDIVRNVAEYFTEDIFTESKGRMADLIASLLRDPIPISSMHGLDYAS